MSWTRYANAYYVLNIVPVLSYIIVRSITTSAELEDDDSYFGIKREYEIYILAFVSLLLNLRKATSKDGVIAAIFTHCKMVVAACSYYLDVRIFGWFVVYCIILFVAISQPKYAGPSNLVSITPSNLDETLALSGPKSASAKRRQKNSKKQSVSWLLYFHTDWNNRCLEHDAVAARLSIKYASPALQFGEVDVGKYPELAPKFNIIASTTSEQLPSFILFREGEEKKRVPQLDAMGRAHRTRLDESTLAKYFKLQNYENE